MDNKKNILAKSNMNITIFFKGIAILLVILVHSHQRFNLSDSCNAIPRFAQMGCQIFFVLSSFGLCHTFSKESPKWFSHMRKRISKLAIGYWGAIFIHAVYRTLMAIASKKDILSSVDFPGILINILFLNGLIPIGGSNNTIVRGGWYVGTTVVLYALFPLLYKLYFYNKSEFWKKYRIVISPIIIFFMTSTTVIVAGLISPVFACHNNSFVYFSFINQMTPFSLGLVLFDISKRLYNTSFAPWLSIIFCAISVVLFFGNYKYSFVFFPSFVALSFMFLYWYLLNNQKVCDKINNNSNIIVRIINTFGKISFPIYLTHSFVVYDFSTICLKFLRPIYNNDLLWYIILLPIEFCLVYTIGYLYNKLIFSIKCFNTNPK